MSKKYRDDLKGNELKEALQEITVDSSGAYEGANETLQGAVEEVMEISSSRVHENLHDELADLLAALAVAIEGGNQDEIDKCQQNLDDFYTVSSGTGNITSSVVSQQDMKALKNSIDQELEV